MNARRQGGFPCKLRASACGLAAMVLLLMGSQLPLHTAAAEPSRGAVQGKVNTPQGVGRAATVRGFDLFNNPLRHMRRQNTNATGEFLFPNVPAGEYLLVAFPLEADSATYSRSLPARVTVSAGVTITVFLTLTVPSIDGTVLREDDGSPVRQARVTATRGAPSAAVTELTDSSGRFKFFGLSPGTYSLVVHPPRDAVEIQASALLTGTVTEGATWHLGDISLPVSSKRLVGKVMRSTGGGVSGAWIVANKLSGAGSASTTTGSDGNYDLKLGTGRWMVRVQHHKGTATAPNWLYTGGPVMVVFREGGPSVQTLDFTVISTEATVTGRLVRPGGGSFTAGSTRVRLSNQEGFENSAPVAEDGTFLLRAPAGGYVFTVHTAEEGLASPAARRVRLKRGDHENLGDIPLLARNSEIAGTVTDNLGEGVEGVMVRAWRQGGPQVASTQTITDGVYSLKVISGTWDVRPVIPEGMNYAASGAPTRIGVGDSETKRLDMTLTVADAELSGSVVDVASSQVVTDVHGVVLALGGVPGLGSPLDAGSFQFKLPSGAYTVTVGFPPGAHYSMESPVAVSLGVSETKQITLPVGADNAFIAGTLKDPAGNPVTGLGAIVSARRPEAVYRRTSVVTDTATYSVSVPAGSWHMHAALDRDADYTVKLARPMSVTVGAGGTATFDFTIQATNATITGTVTDPTGLPLAAAWVTASEVRTDGGTEPPFRTGKGAGTTGAYSMKVPAGTYVLRAHVPPEWNLLPPLPKSVTVSAGATADGSLVFREVDAQIAGMVTRDGSRSAAYIWAYSERGASAWTETTDGTYSLPVRKKEVWHVGAVYTDYANSKVYRSPERVVLVPDSGTVALDLAMTPTTEDLPTTQAISFDGATAQVIRLSDGTEIHIPAGAMVVTGTVTVRATPKAELSRQQEVQPLSVGYVLEAFDSDGELITGFNQDVSIVLHYTAAQLQALGVTPRALVPSYWDPLTSNWKRADNVVVDTERRTVTIDTDHFTEFAIMADVSQVQGGFSVYLPMVAKAYSGW